MPIWLPSLLLGAVLCAATPRTTHSRRVPSTGWPLGGQIGQGGGWMLITVWVRCFLPVRWPVGVPDCPIPERLVLRGPIFGVPLPSPCHLMARGDFFVFI
jgi:hypothetical protein